MIGEISCKIEKGKESAKIFKQLRHAHSTVESNINIAGASWP